MTMSEAVGSGLTKDSDELTDEDLELLWVVAQHPTASVEEIAEAYGLPPEPIRDDLDSLLDEPDEREVVAPVLFETDVVSYEPDGFAEEIAETLDELVDEPDPDDTEWSFSEREERILVLGLEYPDASAREIANAEKSDRTGAGIGSRSANQSGGPASYIAHPDVNAGNFREVAREYFEEQGNEKPDVSNVEIEPRGTDPNDLLNEDHVEATENEADEEVEDTDGLTCDECDFEADTQRGLSVHHSRAHDAGRWTSTQIETLKTICRHPHNNQPDLGAELGISRSAIQYRVSTISNQIEDWEWARREEIAQRILEEQGVEPPEPETGEMEHICDECDEEFETRGALAAHRDACLNGLTDKQREVLRLVREHPRESQGEIADRIGISGASVSNRMHNTGYTWRERHEAVEEYLERTPVLKIETEERDELDEEGCVEVEFGGKLVEIEVVE